MGMGIEESAAPSTLISAGKVSRVIARAAAFSLGLMALGLLMGDPANMFTGLYRIITMQDLLITDYVYIAGPGAALVNAGAVTLVSICIIRLSGDPYNGFTIVEMGLMAGFSLFGKNLFNRAYNISLSYDTTSRR